MQLLCQYFDSATSMKFNTGVDFKGFTIN